MRPALFTIVFAAAAIAPTAFAQTTSTPDSTSTTSATTTTNGPSTAVNPGTGGNHRSIFLSGVVMTDDSSPVPGDIAILSICGPLERIMARATTMGQFSFEWGNTQGVFTDASQPARSTGNNSATSLTGSRNGSRGFDPVASCDLTADTPGYSSRRVSLYNRAGQDNYDVGAIMIHRIAEGEGHTVSVLALQAPRAAKKDFEKGDKLATSKKPLPALASFREAVKLYPQYADAWLAIGKVQWQMGNKEEARSALNKAMELDNKLVGPWQELGYLACDDSNWAEAARYLDQAVRLDPMSSGTAWYFSALANYNLGRYDVAERNVRTELKFGEGANPHSRYLLGLVLIARHNFEGAAEALRSYIAAAPNAPDIAAAKRELARVETVSSPR